MTSKKYELQEPATVETVVWRPCVVLTECFPSPWGGSDKVEDIVYVASPEMAEAVLRGLKEHGVVLRTEGTTAREGRILTDVDEAVGKALEAHRELAREYLCED